MTNTQINDKILELANYLKIDNKCVAHNARLQSIQINGAVIKNFSFKLFNEYKLSFFNCKFLCEINEAPGFFEIENPVYIYGCTFEENVISYNIKFKSNVVIAYCRFNKNFYFKANTFCNSSNFERNFYNYASFKKSHFEKNVTFYNSTFKGLDFSQAIFNENLNIVNTKLNFTFSNLEEKIEQEYEEFNKNKKEEDQKSLDKFANDFRDSFRTFKSALIKDNNALDASNFHKYELYCKEIELKQNWDKKGENVKNTTDLEKNVSRIRDFMDFLLLGFYRKLCDHHTDFLKVFNNLILLIALYALFVSLYICLVYTKSLFFGRYVVLIFSYIVFIIMLIKQPNVIHPLIGKIANESDKFFNYPSLIVLNILYTILLALVLFSLQKTARKNSIVPS
ncbi:pentapeptide repeat-containing protein [Campylobacter jejuni]|uniref:pentapeptide repeat-containing protein n=1 Tax=Campylobacter jejuni TaxID=197 RepID=UPI002FE4E240